MSKLTTLVLSRKKNQAIILRDENGEFIARVTVTTIERRKAVRLALTAPRTVQIHREELLKTETP